MTKETAFSNAFQEIQIKAQLIAGSKTAEEARREYDIGVGYLCALYDTGIFDRDTFIAGSDLLRAAYREAEKKAASSAANTESGNPKNSVFSIATMPGDVKPGREELYKLICSMRVSRVSDASIVNTLLNMFRPQMIKHGGAEK